jgi:hypothetical protein
VEIPLDEVAPRSCTLYGGAQHDAVECCAFPGNGSIIITGIDLDDYGEQAVTSFDDVTMHRMQRRKQWVRAGVLQSLIHLRQSEQKEWFQQLPGGTRRFGLTRMMLSYLDKHAKERKEVKGDLHIHFSDANRLCSAFTGAAVALVIAQVMTGYMLFRKVAAIGEVTITGDMLPVLRLPEVITLRDIDLYLVGEYEGDDVCTKPKGPPQLEVKGFSRLQDMLMYAFDEKIVGSQKPQRAESEEDGKKMGEGGLPEREAEGEGASQP